jgi:hypothetical protein
MENILKMRKKLTLNLNTKKTGHRPQQDAVS